MPIPTEITIKESALLLQQICFENYHRRPYAAFLSAAMPQRIPKGDDSFFSEPGDDLPPLDKICLFAT